MLIRVCLSAFAVVMLIKCARVSIVVDKEELISLPSLFSSTFSFLAPLLIDSTAIRKLGFFFSIHCPFTLKLVWRHLGAYTVHIFMVIQNRPSVHELSHVDGRECRVALVAS